MNPQRTALDWPSHLYIEGSVHCNCQCITCPSPVIVRPDMSLSMAKSIIDQCVGHQVKELHPFLYADPFVWPHLFELMKYAKKKLPGIQIHLWTNGVLLTEKNARKAIECGLDNLAISIDGNSAETHNAIRPGAPYGTVIDHAFRFLEIAPQHIFVRVHMTVTRANQHEVPAFLDFWGKLLEGRGEASTHLNDGRGERVGRLPAHYDGGRPEYPCVQPFCGLFVLSDGRVTQCCIDYNAETPLGNLHYQTVEEVWTGPVATRVRELHNAGRKTELAPCNQCKTYM
jgi:sulfatase maturation enzyme AslB (radical SAM superfamily)